MISHYFSGTGHTCIFRDARGALCELASDSPVHAAESAFSPGFGSSAENAAALALAEIGFGEHAITLAPILVDALHHRGFEWAGGTVRES